MIKWLYYVPLVALLIPHGVSGQSLDDLELTTQNDSALVFDYRMHRNPAYIYKYLLTQKKTKHLPFVHLYRGHVVHEYSYDLLKKGQVLESSSDSAGVSIDQPTTGTVKVKTEDKKLFRDVTGSRKFYRVDVQLEPYYVARFGDIDDPFRTQIGLGPRLELAAKFGLYGVFQWLIPLQNDFDYIKGYGTRPGEIGLGYTYIHQKQHFLNVFAGTFSNRRYGIYADYFWMLPEGKWYIGASGYYTGGYIFEENTFTRELIGLVTGNVWVAYRFPQSGVSIRLMGERFLDKDLGIKVEITRQFGNTDIGLYAQKTETGENAGIKVALALWPRKFYRNSWFQIRPPATFGLQYDLRANIASGTSIRPLTPFYEDLLRYNRHFIDNQLKKSGL